MRRNINITILVILVVLLIIASPLAVARLISIQGFKWMIINNDWIGFWGGYLGGLVTLVGVCLTIIYTREDEKRRQKLAIRPYINIERYYSNEIAESTSTPLELSINESATFGKEYSVRINEIFLICVIKNVGLGTAINCEISQVYIENKSINAITKILPALQVNGISYIRIDLSQIDLHEEDLSLLFITENKKISEYDKNSKRPDLHIKLKLRFEDLLGNQLIQEYTFCTQVSGRIPVELSVKAPLFIDCINKPKEYCK